MKAAAVIVAAGTGARFGGPVPKQFLLLCGKPVLRWSLELFDRAGAIERIVAVCDPARTGDVMEMAAGLAIPVTTVPGGAERTDSVRAGLEALSDDPPHSVLIHDAARPGASDELVRSLLAALQNRDGAAPALPVRDAIKRNEDGAPGEEIGRAGLLAVQTPQAFRYGALMDAYRALPPGMALSDDAAAARRAGLRLAAVAGERMNFKITEREDLVMMETLLAARGAVSTAVGHGFDVHRLTAGDGVTLCGVRIDCGYRLEGHSDADAGLHAICDALLGTIGAGDIGQHFPPSDPQWRGADSSAFVTHCLDLMRMAGARPVHADVTLICERPRIGPHREAMKTRLAALLGLSPGRVNVKATTTERLGYLGRGEGLAAEAVVTAEIGKG